MLSQGLPDAHACTSGPWRSASGRRTRSWSRRRGYINQGSHVCMCVYIHTAVFIQIAIDADVHTLTDVYAQNVGIQV